MNQISAEELLIPRLLASNALRANPSKHMDLNKMAQAGGVGLLRLSPEPSLPRRADELRVYLKIRTIQEGNKYENPAYR